MVGHTVPQTDREGHNSPTIVRVVTHGDMCLASGVGINTSRVHARGSSFGSKYTRMDMRPRGRDQRLCEGDTWYVDLGRESESARISPLTFTFCAERACQGMLLTEPTSIDALSTDSCPNPVSRSLYPRLSTEFGHDIEHLKPSLRVLAGASCTSSSEWTATFWTYVSSTVDFGCIYDTVTSVLGPITEHHTMIQWSSIHFFDLSKPLQYSVLCRGGQAVGQPATAQVSLVHPTSNTCICDK